MTRLLILALIAGCAGQDPAPGDTAAEEAEPFDPYRAIYTQDLPVVRGWRLWRGAIHVHTVHSWDACDEKGYIDGEGNTDYDGGSRNEQCYEDLRLALCDAGLDFAFITDHTRHFPSFEYPEVLLYEPDLGDVLIEKNGHPAFNHMACAERPEGVHLSIGIDVDLLGVGFERHIAETEAERAELYSLRKDQRLVDLAHENGGLGLGGYVPRWNEDDFYATDLDAIEIYNPVFNLRNRIGETLGLVGEMTQDADAVPVPELGLYVVFEESEDTLERWAKRAQVRRADSFLGSNAHRNVLPTPMWDGERLDGYRRNLHWFSNYVMLPEDAEPGIDNFEEALAAGRTFGAFDAIGTPQGFDVTAEADGEVFDLGSEIDGTQATFHITLPTVAGLGPNDDPPEVVGRLLRAEADGTWQEVGRGEGSFEVEVAEAGAYRVEVHMTPHHLRPWLGSDPDRFFKDALWIYASPIYVGMDYAARAELDVEDLIGAKPSSSPAPSAPLGCFHDHDLDADVSASDWAPPHR